MKIIYNNIIPFKGYKAINLFGILFVRKDCKSKITNITLNHETIHTKQIKELCYIPFYLMYVIEWFIRLFGNNFNSHKAYRKISFEQEAYDNQFNLNYPIERKKYAWKKYFKNK